MSEGVPTRQSPFVSLSGAFDKLVDSAVTIKTAKELARLDAGDDEPIGEPVQTGRASNSNGENIQFGTTNLAIPGGTNTLLIGGGILLLVVVAVGIAKFAG